MDKHHMIRVYLQGVPWSQREAAKLQLLQMSPAELAMFRRQHFLKKVRPRRAKSTPSISTSPRTPCLQMSEEGAFRQPAK